MKLTSRSACGALLLAVFSIPQARATGPAAILGWWHGTSTCVRAAWNASCNDEHVLYEFTFRPPDSTSLLLHGSKIVQGQIVPMGDQELAYVSRDSSWEGDFANARVSIRWRFQLRGDTLIGQLLVRPDMRVARHVIAQRGKLIVF